ncbi:glycosyltransferase family A protein [Terrabacter carboxydivorans]|uniref:Glycosyltransferase 2-like domain-containing protein n=1 Tax=Terrabacter carboxydivorans TaxID=619730 RepID=A0ABN3M187_9MICO
MPQVSVVLPVHNPGADLSRALGSVLAQTCPDLEVVVVDDGSDHGVEWVRDLDPRVVHVRQDNQGVSVARNVAVARARGELVAFIDQDDVWGPEKLERQIAAVAAQPDAAFWCTWFSWVVDGSRIGGDERDLTYRGLLADRMVCQSSAMVRRADYLRVGGQNPLLAQTQDWDLFLRLALDRPDPAVVAEDLVDVHLHGNNASRDYARGARERRMILQQHRTRAHARSDHETERAVRAGLRRTAEIYGSQAVEQARLALAQGSRADAAQHVRSAVGISPRVVVDSVLQSARRRLAPRG